MLPTPYKQLITIGLLAAVLGGCEATGDAGGTRTFSDDAVPFEFEVPSDFTDETIDDANSRGEVLAAVGLSKVDLIAVRRVSPGAKPPTGPQRHEVLGHEVTSELHAVEGADEYRIECQYTEESAEKVRSACADALDSIVGK